MHDWGRTGQSTRPRHAQGNAPLPGVIDTIGLGYAALALRPLIVLPPVLLDLYLWLGVRITARPFTARVAGWLRDEGSAGASAARELRRWDDFNLFELLSLRLPTFRVPTLLPNLTVGAVSESLQVSFGPWWLIAVLLMILFGFGFVLGGAWLTALAFATAGTGAMRDALRPGVAGRNALAIAGWFAALCGLFLLVSSPFIIGTVVAEIVGFEGVAFILLMLLFPAAWGFVYFFFSVQALVVDRIGAFAAMRASYLVVRAFFWQSVRFILISLTITTGFPFALRVFTGNSAGLLIAIIGNAFIASGMIAAAMLFYRDRARRLGLLAFVPER